MSSGPNTEEQPGWLLFEKMEGAYSIDIDGNRYIDWSNGFGPHILGYNPPVVVDAVKAELESAGMHQIFWHTRLKQQALAELIAESSPTVIEQVLFLNTGSEATHNAMKAGRAFTGKEKVAVFDGFYHGSHDCAHVGNVRTGRKGVPQGVLDSMMVLPYNSDEALDLIREHKDELALVMVEAIQGTCPQKDHGEWHHALAATCKECGEESPSLCLSLFSLCVCSLRSLSLSVSFGSLCAVVRSQIAGPNAKPRTLIDSGNFDSGISTLTSDASVSSCMGGMQVCYWRLTRPSVATASSTVAAIVTSISSRIS